MDEKMRWLQKLRDDLLEQFRDKPNIKIFQTALARQFAELYEFYDDLIAFRGLESAAGVQLDNIGNIVELSRAEALAISSSTSKDVPMDDEMYRLYLKWKIALNTSNCTHSDTHKALKMFWDKSPIYRHEDPAHPATLFFTIPIRITEAEEVIFNIASMVKAAGVALHFIFPDDEFESSQYTAGAISDFIAEYITEEVEIDTDGEDIFAGGAMDRLYDYHMSDAGIELAMIETENSDITASGVREMTYDYYREVLDDIVEETMLETESSDIMASAVRDTTYDYHKEV